MIPQSLRAHSRILILQQSRQHLSHQASSCLAIRPITTTAVRYSPRLDELKKYENEISNILVGKPEATPEVVPPEPLPRSHRPSRTISTITPAEKRVFNQIFSSFSTSKSGQLKAMFKRSKSRDKGRKILTREEVLNMYPPSLRQAVEARLLEEEERESMAAEVPDIQLSAEEQARMDELQAKRAAEQERVKAILEECKTDQAVWQALETEVFSLISKMGISQANSTSKGSETVNAEDTPEETKAELEAADAAADVAADLLEVHAPIFAKHVLLAVRRLIYDFEHPSPLVLAVIPSLKNLGLAAYVLGATTSLYNETIRASWALQGNIPDVLALSKEINEVGLKYGKDTLVVLEEIITEMNDLKDAVDCFAEPLVGLPGHDVEARILLRKEFVTIKKAIAQDSDSSGTRRQARESGLHSRGGFSGRGRGSGRGGFFKKGRPPRGGNYNSRGTYRGSSYPSYSRN